MTFPNGFIWGAATSAYQIEGAANEDGRGPSIWDMFCRKAGAVWQGHNGDIACDHYHRYRDDVGRMQELGLQAYRFSIAWPRVLPQGTGSINKAGLDFYDRLIDEVLRAGITPHVTLYQWDYPLALYRQGGWLQPDSSDWFARYVATVVDRLSDRVQRWFTFNEPQMFVGKGFQEGCHAPGERLDFSRVLMIGHNVLLAHGKAVQTIRSRARSQPIVGYALAPDRIAIPASETAEDVRAARQVFFSVTRRDCCNNTWWIDPVVYGRYPEDAMKLFAKDLPPIADDDMAIICQPPDFLGLNVYYGEKFRTGPDGTPQPVPFEPGHAHTGIRWPMVPESIYWASKFTYERYRLPIIISENGMSNIDWISRDGAVHDPQRIDFLHRYLRELRRACAEGVDVRGYFLWSLMDNFEWATGYRERFGIIYVDYPTQKRILKDSAHWYKKVIASNGEML